VRKVAVIGAGAAGCFASIEIKRRLPSCGVTVFEAGPKALAKVAVTGGGRCNLTNSFELIRNLKDAYPRGDKLMRRALSVFSQDDTRTWFAENGVQTVVQDDCCVFPKSQDAMEVVGTLLALMRSCGVELRCGCRVTGVFPDGTVETVRPDGGRDSGLTSVLAARKERFDAVLVTAGGCPKAADAGFLTPLGLEMQAPVPSLFTFNINCAPLRELMGTVVENARVSIPGTNFRASGPLLVTHWGVSGPAALKLSSYAARHLAERGYNETMAVNWLGGCSEQECRAAVEKLIGAAGHRNASNCRPETLPSRLWALLLERSGISPETPARELGRTAVNRLVNTLINDCYGITGKSRWREEFVTCGGVSLSEISLSTMEARRYPGIYFAGEVLDIDAITGGFNLQAAWSTAMCAAKAIIDKAAQTAVSTDTI